MSDETREQWRDVHQGGFVRFVFFFGFVIFTAAAVAIGALLWIVMPESRADELVQICIHRLAWLPVIGVILTASVWPSIG